MPTTIPPFALGRHRRGCYSLPITVSGTSVALGRHTAQGHAIQDLIEDEAPAQLDDPSTSAPQAKS